MKKTYIKVVRILLFLLFVYASVAKLSSWDLFNVQLKQSPLIPINLTLFVAYLIPGIELIIAGLLFFGKTLYYGLLASFYLMFLFSLYLISLVSFFVKVPCSCGGILGHMGYPVHIVFNLVFTVATILALYFYSVDIDEKDSSN